MCLHSVEFDLALLFWVEHKDRKVLMSQRSRSAHLSSAGWLVVHLPVLPLSVSAASPSLIWKISAVLSPQSFIWLDRQDEERQFPPVYPQRFLPLLLRLCLLCCAAKHENQILKHKFESIRIFITYSWVIQKNSNFPMHKCWLIAV